MTVQPPQLERAILAATRAYDAYAASYGYILGELLTALLQARCALAADDMPRAITWCEMADMHMQVIWEDRKGA